jgi:hypothetical protein
MRRWYAENAPQLTLPASATRAFGTSVRSDEQHKPSQRWRT